MRRGLASVRLWLRRSGRAAPPSYCLVAALVAIFALAARSAAAVEIDFTSRPVKRAVVALYDSRHETAVEETRLHRLAEMPLNYLGYRLVYHDVNAALPPADALAGVAGVVTWLLEPLEAPARLAEWLDQVTSQGVKLVVLGDLVPDAPASTRPVVARVLARIGLTSTGEHIDLTLGATVLRRDDGMIGFERPIDRTLPDFPLFEAMPGNVEQHLVIAVPRRGGERYATVVATGPAGGLAAQGFTFYFEPVTNRTVWVLNPFAFFRKALGGDVFPVPDVTTLVGRRVYFSHIDGDGWNNLTEVEGFRDAGMLASEVIAREAIEQYPDLPVSVGVIAGDMDPELGGDLLGRRVARELFALAHVEVASHTYSHPYNWSFFEVYDRAAELDLIERTARPGLHWRERVKLALAGLTGQSAMPERLDKYISGSDELPRTYMRRPFDLTEEVERALAVAESLAPAGKKAKLYQWSGDTTPFEGAIRATREAGVANINGGDSRLDAEYPSVGYVPPISRPVGSERQIYAGNSNENTYTNDWTGPYHGLQQLAATLDNTERPRRLKPFNLYYHMYSGEKPAALRAVKGFLDMARAGRLTPITTSHYARMADDFFAVEIKQIGLRSWEVTNRGALQTVRFDNATGVEIDEDASVGVMGSNRANGALYVALDSAVSRAVVTLTDPQARVDIRRAEHMQLVDSRWLISDLEHAACGLTAMVSGFGPGDMSWRGPAARRFDIAVERAGEQVERLPAISGADGVLSFSIATSGIEPMRLRIACHG